MISNNLRVNGGLENCSAVLQFPAKLRCIDQITVMCDCQRTFDIVQNQRLCIFTGTAACGRITGMTHSDIPMHVLQNLWCEHFIYQSHAFVGRHFSWTIRIPYGNTAAFLPSVL